MMPMRHWRTTCCHAQAYVDLDWQLVVCDECGVVQECGRTHCWAPAVTFSRSGSPRCYKHDPTRKHRWR